MIKQKNIFIVGLAFLLCVHLTIDGQNPSDTIKTSVSKISFIKDNPIVAMLDSLSNLKQFKNASLQYPANITRKFTPDFVPTYSDSVYAIRIAKLKKKSPFDLRYNDDVKGFIDLYGVRKRNLTSRILGLSQLYFPLFEEQLDKHKLPLELKYLAVIESALNPIARSPMAASGLWQFIYTTGKLYGLNVSSYIDDRCDPLKATIAACEHLRDLFSIYNDWSLVLAAYNSGAGNVNKAIRKAGGEVDFWKIKQYLPRETQSYVPAFIAVTYLMNYASEHNLYPIVPKIIYYDVDTIKITQQLTLAQIAEYLNISLEDLQFLNPSYRVGLIPEATDNESYFLRLQRKYVGDFFNNEKAIYAYKTKEQIRQEELIAQKKQEIQERINKNNKKLQEQTDIKKEDTTLVQVTTINPKFYIVKKGENLITIAYKYKCTVKQLQEWNGLKNTIIHSRQKLYLCSQISNTTVTNNVDTVINAADSNQKKINNK